MPSQRSMVNRGLLAVFGVISLVLMTASPSPAQITKSVTGAGAGFGAEYPPGQRGDPIRPCGENPLSTYFATDHIELGHYGTYGGLNVVGVTTALYVGPSSVDIDLDPHYVSPIGTHDEEAVLATGGAACFVPTPVEGTFTVTSPGPEPGIQCGPTSGTLTRAGSAVAIEFIGTCTVKGNINPLTATVTATSTAHLIEGVGTPCTLAPTEEPNPACPVLLEAAAEAGFTFPPDPGSVLQTTYQARRPL